ncbi:hypothetical protein PanWU01x14_272030 [Parasponia andersonii]|uniref:Uncharacterized protein n=1 Tax=Parasponia andersonii TaxID=3476 RepID=A0A2P5B4D5_PARAD|nr:hypothetical protein PanWU01x14_272030 [Parasponia andersonii]
MPLARVGNGSTLSKAVVYQAQGAWNALPDNRDCGLDYCHTIQPWLDSMLRTCLPRAPILTTRTSPHK